MGSSSFSFVTTAGMLLVLLVYELLVRRGKLCYDTQDYSHCLTANVFASIPLVILMCMFGLTSDNFVYFQF